MGVSRENVELHSIQSSFIGAISMNGKSRRLKLFATGSVLVLSALGSAAAPANAASAAAPAGAAMARHASTSVSAQWMGHIVNYHSHLCLGITGGQDNAPAVQWNCDYSAGHPDQEWWASQAIAPGSPYTQIVNSAGECLGIAGGSTAEGAKVVGWNCLGTPDQYWETYATCSGQYILINYKSGDVLGVAGNSTAEGAPIVQWNYQSDCTNNQWWYSVWQ
jgi:hypothetical protein